MNSEPEAVEMNPKRESLLLAGAQVVVLLLCLGAIVWTVVTGLFLNIDGLLLLLIGVSVGAVFTFTLFLHVKSEGWLTKLPRPGRKKAAEESAAPAGEKAAAGESK